MADEDKNIDEQLAESARMYKYLYDKACPEFKNKIKTGKCRFNMATKLNLKTGKKKSKAFKVHAVRWGQWSRYILKTCSYCSRITPLFYLFL